MEGTMDEALLLVGESESDQNLYYKTHFLAGDPFVYIERDGQRTLVVSPLEQGRAQKESTVDDVRTFDDFGYTDLYRETNDRVRAFTGMLERIVNGSAASVRVEGLFPVLYADRLRAGGVQLEVDPELLRGDRRRKHANEIAAVEEAQRATERAAAHAIDIIRQSEDLNGVLHIGGIPLTAERLRTEIELSLLRDGMDPGDVIAAGGPAAADPHFRGSGSLHVGEAIVLDIFPRSKRTRYYADMTRTVVKGEPSAALQAMYDAVLAAQVAALSKIAPGANGRDVHEAVLEVYRQRGYGPDGGPWMPHGTGHGVGLDIHEGPNLSIGDVELQEGDVVTVEPGLYDPQIGAIRIEDLVVVTGNGYRNLTRFPKEFSV
jgi:Xaa-Pro aminopeptidase